MDTKIRIYLDHIRTYRYSYSNEKYSIRVYLSDLLKDPLWCNQLVEKGYIFFDYRIDHRHKTPNIDELRMLRSEYFQLENKGELYTTSDSEPYLLKLYRPGMKKVPIDAKSTIELKAIIGSYTMPYEDSRVYMDVIYFNIYSIGEEERKYLIERYGEPTFIEEDRGEKVRIHNYIIVPVEDVDKLVAVERFRELDDEDHNPIYTGEESVYELDLRSPEESVYQYFLEHRIIIEYDPENFTPQYLYAQRDKVLREQEQENSSWFRRLLRKLFLSGKSRGIDRT